MPGANQRVKCNPHRPRSIELTKTQIAKLTKSIIDISLKDKILGFNSKERAEIAKLLMKMRIVCSPRSVTAASLSNFLIKLRQISKNLSKHVAIKCSDKAHNSTWIENVSITSAKLMITEGKRSFSVQYQQPALPPCKYSVRGSATEGSGGKNPGPHR